MNEEQREMCNELLATLRQRNDDWCAHSRIGQMRGNEVFAPLSPDDDVPAPDEPNYSKYVPGLGDVVKTPAGYERMVEALAGDSVWVSDLGWTPAEKCLVILPAPIEVGDCVEVVRSNAVWFTIGLRFAAASSAIIAPHRADLRIIAKGKA